MNLDTVHDLQHVYRKLIDAMSRPGTVQDIGSEIEKLGDFKGNEGALLVAMTVLDTEVTFHVFSEKQEEVSQLISQLTNAKQAEAEEADFLFVLHDAAEGSLEAAIRRAKAGTLVNPHESATIIAWTSSLSDGNQIVLTGPGIKSETAAKLSLGDEWMKAREEKNSEFPCGIDLIIIAGSSLLCLPRTTQIRQVV